MADKSRYRTCSDCCLSFEASHFSLELKKDKHICPDCMTAILQRFLNSKEDNGRART